MDRKQLVSSGWLAAIWVGTFGSAAFTAPVIVSFEEIPHRGAVLSQYADRGVTFNQATNIDYSLGVLAIPGFAHSGTKAIEQCWAQEFCSVPIEATFTAAQRRVKVWVGFSSPAQEIFTVVLTGFNSSGGQVAQSSVDFPAHNPPRLITTPLEIVAPTQSIFRATVALWWNGQIASSNSLAVDDLEFDTEGPPPPCGSTTPPTVTLTEPTSGTVSQTNSFLLRGTVTTGSPLTQATLTVSGPGGAGYTMDLLSSHLVPLNGGTFGGTRVSPLFPGTNTVVVTAVNCTGSRQASRTISYSPIATGSRFVLDRIEVTQAIQDVDNRVTLLAGKRTVARAYVRMKDPPGGSIANVTGTLIAFRPDGSRPGGPVTVQSLNKITASPAPGLAARRLDVNLSLNFALPPEWTSEGKIHLQLTSLSIDGTFSSLLCDNCGNRTEFNNPRLVEFEAGPPLRVVLWSVPYRSNGVTHVPRETDFSHLESWLRRAYPTSRLIVSRATLGTFNGKPGDDFDCDDVNYRLHQLRTFCFSFFPGLCIDTVGNEIHWYGVVSDNLGFLRGCSRGIPSRVASGPAGSNSWGWDTDGTYADWYGAHELAHTYDRYHPGFCNGNSDDDDDYPYPSGNIGSTHFGFDVGDPVLGIPMQAYSPSSYKDVMTYCERQWMSDYTYEGILDYMRDISGSGGGGGGALADALLVQGEINLTRNEVSLRPFVRVTGLDETPRPATSPLAIVLTDASGKSLARHLIDPVEDTEATAEEDLMASFDYVVPYAKGTQRIGILHNGRELAFRLVSANKPVVRLVSPEGGTGLRTRGLVQVRWEASDADGDPLTYSLLYSTDNGQLWEPIDTGITTLGVDLPLASLRGSDTAKFRIIATDGVNTTQDDQDEPVKIAQKAPEVKILSPAAQAQTSTGSVLVLEGAAFDLEDGHLEDDALEWTDERGNVIGTGASISAVGLAPGARRITLTATDTAGATGTATVSIEVVASAPSAVITSDDLVAVGSTVTLDAKSSQGFGKLAHTWELVAKPKGSVAAIVGLKSRAASLKVDRAGSYTIGLTVRDDTGLASTTRKTIQAVTALPLLRGEVTDDGKVDISDPVRVLGWLFLGDDAPGCLDAADANDDGRADLSDAVHVLMYLFSGGAAPAQPFPGCGIDPTADKLDCKSSACR